VTVYDVPEISCAHCVAAITGEVSTVPGVERVHVDLAARTVTVEGSATDADVRSAIGEAGYAVA
jgi:copper chaperone